MARVERLDTQKERSLLYDIGWMRLAACVDFYRAYSLAVYHHGVGLDDFVALLFIFLCM